MDFTASALGQSFTGNLTVDDTAVHVEVALPWMLDMLVEPLRQQIQQHSQGSCPSRARRAGERRT